jgi:phospholipid/cholesterol/gamma-HCH transport system permease protein
MAQTFGKKSAPDFFLFLGEAFTEVLGLRKNRYVNGTVVLRQVLFTGYQALPIISFIALGIGGLIILQGYAMLSNFGQGVWLHKILVTVVISELSGIITALVVIARSGTAISTELGNMVVRREIDLLRSFSITPMSYLVTARVYGVVLSVMLLSIYFSIIAVLGGWVFTSMFSPIDFRSFMSDFLNELKITTLLVGLLKSLVFGMIISLTACYHGLSVRSAPTEVPQRTIKAVVHSLAWVIIADILITWTIWMLG